MKFLKKYYSQLISLLIGFLVGFCINRSHVQFENKISPIAFATFFLTILLALYLEFIVRPSLSNSRNEKDILIEYINDIKKKLTEVHEVYMAVRENQPVTKEKQLELLLKLREVSNLIYLLKSADNYCKTYQRLGVPGKIISEYLKYKKALTGNKFNDKDFFYDRLYWKEQENSYRQHMKVLVEGVFEYNKAK